MYKKDILKTIEQHDLDLSFLDKKTILFTGASGLIGKYFVDLILSYNHLKSSNINVIALDLRIDKLKKAFQEYDDDNHLVLLEHDITKEIDLNAKIDYIIHAASPANPYFYSHYPVETINANYIGSLNMLNLANEKKVSKYIFISSGEVYGFASNDMGLNENDIGIVDCSISRSCYTEGKRCSETLAHCFYDEYKLPIIVARLCHTYGPTYDEKDNRVIFQFINNFLKNENILMKSDGSQVRSYCYVGDTVCALLKLMECGTDNETYNIANNSSKCNIRQIAEKIISLSNNSIKLITDAPSNMEKSGYSPFKNAVLDASKIENIGFKAKVSLEEGLKRTIMCKKGAR